MTELLGYLLAIVAAVRIGWLLGRANEEKEYERGFADGHRAAFECFECLELEETSPS